MDIQYFNFMNSRDRPTLEQIQQDNEQLKEALRRLKEEQQNRKEQNEREPESSKGEFDRRVEGNTNRLR
jgi:hypothetical protein